MSVSLTTTFVEPVPSHPATIELGSIGSLKVKVMVSPWSRRPAADPAAPTACTSTAVGAMLSVIVTVAMFPVVVPSKARVGERVGAVGAGVGGVGERAVGVEDHGAVAGSSTSSAVRVSPSGSVSSASTPCGPPGTVRMAVWSDRGGVVVRRPGRC